CAVTATNSFSVVLFNGMILSKDGLHSVNVPVLSVITTLVFCKSSNASAFLIRIPYSAPLPMPIDIETGVAKPNAHGQAIINTAMAFCKPNNNEASLDKYPQ